MPKVIRTSPSASTREVVKAAGSPSGAIRKENEALIAFNGLESYVVDPSTLTITDEQGEYVTLDLDALGLRLA